ncbi:hypothetical protein F2Q68_00023010 [Brassica cretica]|uniref:Peptidase A1 domain-containing protein n=1 Tax=Brassica cretica TaxID=69181 RepID=A0A8S9G0B5_BRACR|nr:hypothetical protein F2Q68_00023010 [Brassica cretica]
MSSRSAFLLFFILSLASEKSLASLLSSRLIHRFSDEGRASIKSPATSFPSKRSFEYYRLLASIDLSRRQRMNLGAKSQSLVPSEGSKTISSGNDFGWLHYTWIDIGTPSVSFLVALDSGSDLLWIPCNCVQCAPLSSTYYTSLVHASSSSSPHIFFCRLLKILTSTIPQLQPPARCSPAAISSASQLQPVRVRRSNVLIPLATLATIKSPATSFPSKRSFEYYWLLASIDLRR